MNASALEAIANATIGLAVSWAATVYVLGYTPTAGVAVSAMFFALSTIRSFLIREAFRKWMGI